MNLNTIIIIIIIMYDVVCYWEPKLSESTVKDLLKDEYQGCSLYRNNILLDLTSLIYEYDIKSHYKSVWLDIGANQGIFTKQVADVINNALIYSFEPFYPAYKSFQWRLQDYTNIIVFIIFILIVI